MNKIFKLLAVLMLFSALSAGSMTVQAETATNVAQVGDTNYATLTDAITAANAEVTSGTGNVVITLLADITLDDNVTIGDKITLNLGGKTLNLNGKTLDVYGLVSVGGNVVDNSDDRDGLLKLGNGNCSFSTTNSQVPVYNTTKGGYVFATMTEQVYRDSDPGADTFKLIFKPDFGAVNELLANGSADAKVSIGINLEWTGANGTETQPLVYTNSMVKTVYGNSGKAFYIELTGFSNVDNLTITPIVKSELGTEWSDSEFKATEAPTNVTITFVDHDGNTLNGNGYNLTLEQGASITIPEGPTRADDINTSAKTITKYTFAGWKNGEETLTSGTTATENVTYKATYTEVTSTLIDYIDGTSLPSDWAGQGNETKGLTVAAGEIDPIDNGNYVAKLYTTADAGGPFLKKTMSLDDYDALTIEFRVLTTNDATAQVRFKDLPTMWYGATSGNWINVKIEMIETATEGTWTATAYTFDTETNAYIMDTKYQNRSVTFGSTQIRILGNIDSDSIVYYDDIKIYTPKTTN